MPGPVGQIGHGPALPARVVAAHRVVRVVERACGGRPEPQRRGSDCCPPASPPPYSCFLEDRNARDRVELTFSEHLARLPGAPAPERRVRDDDDEAAPIAFCVERAGRGHEDLGARDPALRGARLGDVSPVAALPVSAAPAAPSPRLDVTA